MAKNINKKFHILITATFDKLDNFGLIIYLVIIVVILGDQIISQISKYFNTIGRVAPFLLQFNNHRTG